MKKLLKIISSVAMALGFIFGTSLVGEANASSVGSKDDSFRFSTYKLVNKPYLLDEKVENGYAKLFKNKPYNIISLNIKTKTGQSNITFNVLKNEGSFKVVSEKNRIIKNSNSNKEIAYTNNPKLVGSVGKININDSKITITFEKGKYKSVFKLANGSVILH